MDLHIIWVDQDLIQVQIDELLHLRKGSAVKHPLRLTEGFPDGVLTQFLFPAVTAFHLNLKIQLFFLLLQLVKLVHQSSAACVGNHINNVGDFLFHGFQVLPKGANLLPFFPAFLLVQLLVCLDNPRYPGFVKNDFFNLSQHQFLQRLLVDVLIAAGVGTMVLSVIAEVGSDDGSILFTTSLHSVTTVSVPAQTAEHHAGQQVCPFSGTPSMAFSAGQNALNPGKSFIVHNLGHTTGNADLILYGLVPVIVSPSQFVLAGRPAEHIDAIVLFIAQHFVQCFLGEGIAQSGTVAQGVQFVQDHTIPTAVGHIPEDHPDSLRLILVDDVSAGLRIYPETVRYPAADVTTIHSRFSHSFHNLTGKILGVILAHTLQYGFQDDTLRTVIHLLQHRKQLHPVLLQLPFVVGTVVPVPTEAVQLVDNGKVKVSFLGCCNHLQKFRPIIGGCRFGPVTIFVHNHDRIPGAKLVHCPKLGFNGFLSLVI